MIHSAKVLGFSCLLGLGFFNLPLATILPVLDSPEPAAAVSSPPAVDPSDGEAGAASPSSAVEIPAKSTATPPEDEIDRWGQGLWMGLGLAGVILAAISGGVAIALWQKLQQATAEFDAVKESAYSQDISSQNDPGTDTNLTDSSPVTLADSSGRLARVNIVNELSADLQSPDPAVRHRAIWDLGQKGHSAAVQPLVDRFLDADSKERSLILAALSEIGTHTLQPMNQALALSLQDPNPEVRKNAIRDLTRFYDLVSQASQMLSHASQDSSPEVQSTARWALDRLGSMRLLSANPTANLSVETHPPELSPKDSNS